MKKKTIITQCDHTNQKLPLRRILRQFLATVCIGSVSLGASISWTSPVLPQLESVNSTVRVTTEEASWVGSTLALGALISAIPAGYVADRFGRKTCTLAFVVPVLLFCGLILTATNVYYLYAARMLSGFATGGVSVVAPMYIGEISDVQLRGILGTFFELLIYVGILVSAVLGAYVNYITLTVVLGVIAGVLGACFVFFPESPTYLMMINKKSLAEKSLRFYRGKKYDVSKDLDLIQEELDLIDKRKGSLWDLWKSKAAMRGLVACVGLTAFQQLCAVDAVMFYCVYVFQTAGTSIDAYTSSVITSVIQLISATFAVFVIEKFNRCTFLYISTFGLGISLALFGAYFQIKNAGYNFQGMDLIPLASMISYFIFFAVGLGPIPWLINGELFSSEIKGPANGITIATNWTMLFLVTKSFPVMLDKMEPQYTFYSFAALMVLCLVFIRFCVPETRGKTLPDIQVELSK
ncbi:facilitated trehalose transporter Tret1-like isoform X1 [Agrilus planipennis]|uniref:Facilitated trehalose transporter Tret1-like isoform X1 n=2 Tax=Agrilus planipennis TaxID=224129 RepID=A0A1W4X0R9_AGRPL|nr:facilitated trehalose transporter Tret1-like isoform X1 [Agrilus planipennis]